jgi:hypothetical protein
MPVRGLASRSRSVAPKSVAATSPFPSVAVRGGCRAEPEQLAPQRVQFTRRPRAFPQQGAEPPPGCRLRSV